MFKNVLYDNNLYKILYYVNWSKYKTLICRYFLNKKDKLFLYIIITIIIFYLFSFSYLIKLIKLAC